MADKFRITLGQLNPTVGDIDGKCGQGAVRLGGWKGGFC